MKGVHNFWGRVLIIVVACVVGLIFPFAFIVAVFMGYTIYADLQTEHSGVKPEPIPESPLFYDQDKDGTWQERSEERTESVAEQAFVRAMIKAFGLSPAGDDLAGGGIVFAFQREILRYRVDFILNDWLIVEIDGAEWHSSPEAVERDRIRDAALSELDYSIIRIPAKTVFQTPKLAVKQVREALEKPTTPITPAQRDRRKKAAQPKVKAVDRVVGGIKAVGTAIDDLERFTQQSRERQKVEDALAKPKQTFDIEKSLIDNAIRSAKLEIKVDGMGAEFKESYLRNKRELDDLLPPQPNLQAMFGKFGLVFGSTPKTGIADFDTAVTARFLELKEERRQYLNGVVASLDGKDLQKLVLQKLEKSAGYILAEELASRLGMNFFDYIR